MHDFGVFGKWSSETLLAQGEYVDNYGGTTYTIQILADKEESLFKKYNKSIAKLEKELKVKIPLKPRLCGKLNVKELLALYTTITVVKDEINTLKEKKSQMESDYHRMTRVLSDLKH